MILALLFVACGCGGDSGGPTTSGMGLGGGASSSGADGSSSAGGGSTADGGTEWTGQATGNPLFIQMQLAIRLFASSPTSYASVGVLDSTTSKQLDGATVTLTPKGGQPVVLTGGKGIPYQKGFAAGWAPSYELSVTHPSGSRTGIIVTPPSAHAVAIKPPPKVDTPSTVTWTPSGETDVGVYVLLGKYGTPTASPLPDTGSFEVPATAFPSPGGNYVTLEVQRTRAVSVPQQLSIQIIVSAYEGPAAVQP